MCQSDWPEPVSLGSCLLSRLQHTAREITRTGLCHPERAVTEPGSAEEFDDVGLDRLFLFLSLPQ